MRLFLRIECRIHQKYQFGNSRPMVTSIFQVDMEWPQTATLISRSTNSFWLFWPKKQEFWFFAEETLVQIVVKAISEVWFFWIISDSLQISQFFFKLFFILLFFNFPYVLVSAKMRVRASIGLILLFAYAFAQTKLSV
jgi:hypothetical protein